MTTLREAAQMALDALDSDNLDIQLRAAIHLRAALAQPEQDDGYCQACEGNYCTAKDGCVARDNPPQREWQGLTDEEKLTIVRETDNPVDALAATEAKLKEKNSG